MTTACLYFLIMVAIEIVPLANKERKEMNKSVHHGSGFSTSENSKGPRCDFMQHWARVPEYIKRKTPHTSRAYI